MRLTQIDFRYARRAPWTLRAVTATLRAGETAVVLGPNGAGKSTLLQLAAGVLRPTRGAVHDRPAVVGWVPERFPADQPFTAAQYLTRMATLRGRGDPDVWIDRLGLGPHRHTRLADLSKGTAQKVGLAQALLVPPGLLVLDEPWEGLDADARALVPEIIAEVTAAGGAVLVSDHRNEIAGLPHATRWTVTDGTLHCGPGGGPLTAPGEAGRPPHRPLAADDEPGDEVIVEVVVRRSEADAAVAGLRAAGHRVAGVRERA